MDKPTVKQYAPDLLMQKHRNICISKSKALNIVRDNLLESNNVSKYRSISSSFISNIPSFVFMPSFNGLPNYWTVTEFRYLIQEMLNNRSESRCLIYGMQQNVDA